MRPKTGLFRAKQQKCAGIWQIWIGGVGVKGAKNVELLRSGPFRNGLVGLRQRLCLDQGTGTVVGEKFQQAGVWRTAIQDDNGAHAVSVLGIMPPAITPLLINSRA